jgi:hypothetical protein
MLNDDIKSNTKRLWSFIKCKRCDSTGVVPLTKGGNTHRKRPTFSTTSLHQFSLKRIQLMGPSPFPELEHIEIHPNGITNAPVSLKFKQCNRT